ncbi:MAG TPA: cupin domain-containing protein [Actinomycetota bacterium]|jgi:lysine-specific demethylase/histidyl-hydroxylase NO66|nr:cupin domain-containing protein [Actinomycetota bacterium]
MTATTAALERCVGDVRRFADGRWGQRPLLHRRPGATFDDLLNLADVDHLVTGTLLRLPAIRLIRDGTPIPPSSYTHTITVGSRRVPETVRPERVLDAFAQGATIVLQALHRQRPSVARFCRELELALTHPVQANAYVTPATSRGLAVHHDTHDVFVLQTHGKKSWRVYPPIVELAGKEQRWSKELGDPGSPMLEAELEPGDALYIPRGFPHDAEAQEDVSVHVTVGILARTWLDVWRHVMNEAADHAPFREQLPIGFARDPGALAEEMAVRAGEFRAWFDKVAGSETASSFVREFWTHRRPVLDGALLQVAGLGRLGPSTALRRRPGSVFDVSGDGLEAVVGLGDRELRMPAFVSSDLLFIAETRDRFTAGDLPGDLDVDSRLVLLRRLVREGALEVVDLGD